MVILMIPNIIYSIKYPESFENKYKNKTVLILEQVGRYACFFLMVFNIPYTYIGYYFPNGPIIYLGFNIICLIAYIFSWIICWNKRETLRAYLLSIIPSTMFLGCGIIIASFPLIGFAIIFGSCHITISIKNMKMKRSFI